MLDASSFVLLSQDCFPIWGLLLSHRNFTIVHSISMKNIIAILIRIVLNPYIVLHIMNTSATWILLLHELYLCLLPFLSFISFINLLYFIVSNIQVFHNLGLCHSHSNWGSKPQLPPGVKKMLQVLKWLCHPIQFWGLPSMSFLELPFTFLALRDQNTLTKNQRVLIWDSDGLPIVYKEDPTVFLT